MITISEIVEVSDEVKNRHVKGTIELYKLKSEESDFEKDSETIFNCTYPTKAIKKIVDFINRKIDPKKQSDTRSSFAVTGTYGTGKSHILTTVYHILNDPTKSKEWLRKNNMEFELIPAFPKTAILPMLNLDKKYQFLWEPIYEQLEKQELMKNIGDFPTVSDIKKLIGDGTVAIFIDEIEKWYGSISEEQESRKTANLAFLQNLMDVANEKKVKLFVFITLLLENSDIMGVMQRTNPIKFDLTSNDEDKIKIIQYRLISRIKDKDAIDTIAKQYVGLYKRSEHLTLPKYKELEEMLIEQYPFHPEVLKVLLERFHAGKDYQNTRGLLYLLAEILYAKMNFVDLIIMSDIDVELTIDGEDIIKDELVWIDDKIVENCIEDIKRLKEQKFAKEALNTILIYSLTKKGRSGANKTNLLLGILRQGINSNEVMMIFTGNVFRKAWYLHKLNGEYAIEEEPNPYAVLEAGAEDISKDDAIARIERMLLEDVFTGSEVYILDPISGGSSIPDLKLFKIAVSLDGNDISYERFKPFFEGKTYQNTLVIVVPKKGTTLKSTGLIEMARRLCAGEKIAGEDKELPEGFNEIVADEKKSLKERIVEKYGRVLKIVGDNTIPKNISSATKEAVINTVKPDIDNVKSAVMEIAQKTGDRGIRVDFLREDLYIKREYPTITDDGLITTALKELTKDKEIKLTSQSGVDYFGERSVTIVDSMYVFHKDFVSITPPPEPGIWTSHPPGEEVGEPVGGGETTLPQPPVQRSTVTVPPMAPISATTKPELVDKLDRLINSGESIEEIDLRISGGLESDDIDVLGLPKVAVIEAGSTHAIAIILKTHMSKNDLVKFLRTLKAPKRATFELQMEVTKE